MKRNQKGFSVPEGLLILLFVAIVGGVGWYVWHVRRQSAKPASNPTNSVTQFTPPPAGWQTYKSTHSSISFAYPSDWQLAAAPPDNQNQYILEDMILNGPNNFSMEFKLETKHTVLQVAYCTLPSETNVTISDHYQMVLDGFELYLHDSRPDHHALYGCDRTYNLASPNMEFSFTGGYKVPANVERVRIPPDQFLKEPEVEMAKNIYASFKQ